MLSNDTIDTLEITKVRELYIKRACNDEGKLYLPLRIRRIRRRIRRELGAKRQLWRLAHHDSFDQQESRSAEHWVGPKRYFASTKSGLIEFRVWIVPEDYPPEYCQTT